MFPSDQRAISVVLMSFACIITRYEYDKENDRSVYQLILHAIGFTDQYQSISFFLSFSKSHRFARPQILIAHSDHCWIQSFFAQWVTASVDFLLSRSFFLSLTRGYQKEIFPPLDLISFRWSIFHIWQDMRTGRTHCICNWLFNHSTGGQTPQEDRETKAWMRS